MKLLVQSDDYGLTDSITSGILKGIRPIEEGTVFLLKPLRLL